MLSPVLLLKKFIENEDIHSVEFHSWLTQKVNCLSSSTLKVIEDLPVHDTYHQYIEHYILHLPKLLNTLWQALFDQGKLEAVDPIFRIIQNFYVNPPGSVNSDQRFIGLIQKCYLTYRYLEELNDHFLVTHGFYIFQLDLINMNLIIHSIIGEPSSSLLDMEIDKVVDEHLSIGYIDSLGQYFSGPLSSETQIPGFVANVNVQLRY